MTLSPELLAELQAVDSDWQLIPCDDRKRPIDPATGEPMTAWASPLDRRLPVLKAGGKSGIGSLECLAKLPPGLCRARAKAKIHQVLVGH